MGRLHKKFRILVSPISANLGDMIQAIALSRLIGEAIPFDRDYPEVNPPQDRLGIVAAWLARSVLADASKLLFAGIYWHPKANNVEWLKQSPYPIGARDPETYRKLRERNVPVELIGCVTATFPRVERHRSGELYVDCKSGTPAMSHVVSRIMPPSKQWALSLEYLDRYSSASLVHTTRLHVTIPCLAMGTPVRYIGPRDDRTSILDSIGVTWGEPCLPDVTRWSVRYKEFLFKHAKIPAIEGSVSEPSPWPLAPRFLRRILPR